MIDYKTAREVIVTNQAEMDAIPLDYNGRITINATQRIIVSKKYIRSVEACGNSSVEARDNSSVVAWNNSSVEARGNSSVEAHGNSSVEARDNSSVVAWNNSSVEACGNSSVEAHGNSSVMAWGNSQVVDASDKHNIKVSSNARIVYNPRTAQEYADHIGADIQDGKIHLFKAVHKRDGGYYSDRDRAFAYSAGEEATADRLDPNPKKDCGHGIHAAHVDWCLTYGKIWPDLAILEVEMDLDGLVVPINGDGKVRAAKCRVIREVPLEECGLYGKILAKKRGTQKS